MKGTQETVLHLSSKTRLDALEKMISELSLAMGELAEANQTLTLQLASLTLSLNGSIKRNSILRSELAAMVEIVSGGQTLTADAIKAKVIEASVSDLRKRVEGLKESGVLADADEIAADSFVVGQQLSRENNEVVNARIQFLVSSLEQDTQLKILSKKAGETVDLGDDEPLLYVLEVYRDVGETAPSTLQP